ncbi:MAG: VUT family protein, partial [bacterium]|nr:VUT family protein [bacterium]
MEKKEDHGEFKLYSIFTGIFCTALILVPVVGSKFLAIGSFAINASALVFPITFIFNDILTEVYGYKRSRRIIWTGMGLSPNPNLNPKKANRKVFSAKRLDYLSLNSNSFCFFSFVLFLFPKH